MNAKWPRRAAYGFVVLAAFGIGAGVGSSGHSSPTAGGTSTSAAVAATSSPAATSAATTPPPAPSPTPTPSPNGTYNGACNYTLGNDPVNGTAVATGDIQLTNTGNIGTVTRVTITWPQQGYAPLSETKTVRIPVGGSDDVQFNRPLTETQLSNLQNWQTGHGYQDGCTYAASITDTYGSVKG